MKITSNDPDLIPNEAIFILRDIDGEVYISNMVTGKKKRFPNFKGAPMVKHPDGSMTWTVNEDLDRKGGFVKKENPGR